MCTDAEIVPPVVAVGALELVVGGFGAVADEFAAETPSCSNSCGGESWHRV